MNRVGMTVLPGKRVLRAMAFSSRPARPEHLRAYLDVWMGSVATIPDTRLAAARDGKSSALTVTGRQYLVPTLRLPVDASPSQVDQGLQATASLAASFRSAPIILDLIEWSNAQRLSRRSAPPLETASKLHACITAFRDRGLYPVGVANAYTAELQAAALEFGLPCFMSQQPGLPSPPSASSSRTSPPEAAAVTAPAAEPKCVDSVRPSTQPKEEAAGKGATATTANETTPAEALPPHVVQGSIRTGQQVIASEGRSVVVMGNVHSGAEVAADGDIHVYGKLSGRALAGLSGNTKAKVFAAKFNAELVAIADCFVTGDQPSDLKNLVVNAPTIVSLDEKSRELAFKSF